MKKTTKRRTTRRHTRRKSTPFKRQTAKVARILCIGAIVAVFFGFAVYFLVPNVFYSIYYKVAGTYRPYRGEPFNGIDVSHHNGDISWDRVATNTNIQFVYIKATEGYKHLDECFVYNTTHARKAGLKVGAYHLLTTRTSMATQFKYFADIVDRYEQDLIPVVDIEEDKVSSWTAKQKQDSIAKFLKIAEQHYGTPPIIYCSHKFYKSYLSPDFDNNILFLARYSSQQPTIQGDKHHDIWQFTEHGQIDGIDGDVDLNRFGPGTSIEDILL